MLRRGTVLLATSIPRSAWDPAHHNTNWSDSYATDIAERRHWPAKKWSIGLEPRTPRDWLQFSYRNLAYAYNGALRACQSFPEMLVYYKEMKQRGVKVDVDTMNVLLTRAARYERMQMDDIFLLFDELVALGARPDVSAVETLHTVLDHSAAMPPDWREARRRQLVALYNHLALEEIARVGPHGVDRLLREQLDRLRRNLRQLNAVLSPIAYCRYIPVLRTGAAVLDALHACLWERVAADHPAMDIPALRLRVPFVASALRRPAPDADATKLTREDFGDTEICAVFLAAVERVVDGDFCDERPVTERRMFLSILTMLSYSGVLYTSDLMAQLMDMVKYAEGRADSRDADAQRLLRYAVRGSSAAQDDVQRALWHRTEMVVDSRVVGRYIAARDPWSAVRVCFDDRGLFRPFPVSVHAKRPPKQEHEQEQDETVADEKRRLEAKNDPQQVDEEMNEGVRGGVVVAGNVEESPQNALAHADSSSISAAVSESRTAEALHMRWRDIRRLIERTHALTSAPTALHPQQEKMEVFTGMAVYLRTVATGRHVSDANVNDPFKANRGERQNREVGNSEHLFTDGYGFDVWHQVFANVRDLRQEMEKFIADHSVEPEFECWEALLVTLRCVLDYCVMSNNQPGGEREAAERLFTEAMALRTELVEESRTRFGGRMRVLWLQES